MSRLARTLVVSVVVSLLAASQVNAAKQAGLSESLPAGSAVADKNAAWQKRLAARPHDAATRFEYGQFLLNAGLPDKAISEFEQASQLDPKDPEPLIALSEIYSQNLDQQKALIYSQRALQLQPSSSAARIVLLAALVQRDRIDEAERELHTLLQTNPRNPRVLQLAYAVKTRIGDFNEAAKYLQEAVALQPNNIEWVMELCKLLEASGNASGAYSQLESLLARHPNSLEARERLARNLEVYQHNYNRAMIEYARVLEGDSKSPAALAGIERCKAKKNNLALRMKQALHEWIKPLAQ